MPIANLIELPRSLTKERKAKHRKNPEPVILHKVQGVTLREKEGRFYASNPRFTLRLIHPGKWTLSAFDSSGVYRRLTLNEAPELDEAVAKSLRIISGDIDPNRPPELNPAIQNLGDFFALWVNQLTVKPSTRVNYEYSIVRFLKWCEEEQLEVLCHLSRTTLANYLAYLANECEMSRNAVRLFCFPVISALRWAALNWPDHVRDLTLGFKVKGIRKHTLARPVLNLDDSIRFCETLRARMDKALPGVALQCLAGLRVQEAFRLEWSKVDLERGLVEISGEVKNPASARIIPVADYVLDLLKRFRKVSKGRNVLEGFDAWQGYSKRVTHCLNSDLSAFGTVASTLRKTLESSACAKGWGDLTALNRYCGREASGVQGRFYVCLTPSQWVDVFRAQIVEPLNAQISEILQFGDGSPKKQRNFGV